MCCPSVCIRLLYSCHVLPVDGCNEKPLSQCVFNGQNVIVIAVGDDERSGQIHVDSLVWSLSKVVDHDRYLGLHVVGFLKCTKSAVFAILVDV